VHPDSGRLRPPAVTEISVSIIMGASVLAFIGLAMTAITLFVRANGSDAEPWPGLALFAIGVLLVTVATAFYRLKRWAYPLMRFLLGPWGLGGVSIWDGGFNRKFDSPEVRQAFGLSPLHPDAPGATPQVDEPPDRQEKS
jgi:multisubunit Na+/H+ antiporter MnhB subunit